MSSKAKTPPAYFIAVDESWVDGLDEFGTEEQALAYVLEEMDVDSKPYILKVIGHVEAPVVKGQLIRYEE